MDLIQELLLDGRQHVHKSLEVSDEAVHRLHDRVMRALPQEQKSPKKKWVPATVATIAVAATVMAVESTILENILIKPQPGEIESTHPTVPPIDHDQQGLFSNLSDDDKLLLIKYVPIGESYETLKNKIRELSELEPEGKMEGRADKLTEAYAKTRILGHESTVEFNFNEKNLYSFYYQVEKLSQKDADKLYNHLLDFYPKAFGMGKEEQDREKESQSSTTTIWTLDYFQIVVTNNRNYDGLHIVSFGYQEIPEAERITKNMTKANRSPSLEYIQKNLQIGMTGEEVQKVFGDTYTKIVDVESRVPHWRYDYLNDLNYKVQESEENGVLFGVLDEAGFNLGKIQLQIYIGWSQDNLLQNYSVWFKDSKGVLREFHMRKDGTTYGNFE